MISLSDQTQTNCHLENPNYFSVGTFASLHIWDPILTNSYSNLHFINTLFSIYVSNDLKVSNIHRQKKYNLRCDLLNVLAPKHCWVDQIMKPFLLLCLWVYVSFTQRGQFRGVWLRVGQILGPYNCQVSMHPLFHGVV